MILLLTHPWWGAEHLEIKPPVGLRALFIQYPDHSVSPVWADRCERWQSLGPTDHAHLATALGRLLG